MKKPVGRPADHSVEFMIAVAHKVASGELTYREARERYKVSHGSICSWMKKYGRNTLHLMKQKRTSEPKTVRGREAALEAEVKDLKFEIAQLYLQVRMLKKAQEFEDQIRREASSIITSESLERSGAGVK